MKLPRCNSEYSSGQVYSLWERVWVREQNSKTAFIASYPALARIIALIFISIALAGPLNPSAGIEIFTAPSLATPDTSNLSPVPVMPLQLMMLVE